MYKLSIVEKAKRYDEAIKKLRSLHDNYDTVSTLIDVKEELENIFPELAESEDEKIRKEIIDFVKSRGGFKGDWIAWLERQGEQKDILKDATLDNNEDGLIADTIKAKCEQNPADSYCQEHCKGYQETGKCFIDGECKVKKDAEDKDMLNGLIYLMSREIELNNIDFGHLRARRTLEWLKSLKDRVQPKQEWSGEDYKYYDKIGQYLVILLGRTTVPDEIESIDSCIDWLKSLRPQSHWRPSEDQLYALDYVLNYHVFGDTNIREKVQSLYDDLKKL